MTLATWLSDWVIHVERQSPTDWLTDWLTRLLACVKYSHELTQSLIHGRTVKDRVNQWLNRPHTRACTHRRRAQTETRARQTNPDIPISNLSAVYRLRQADCRLTGSRGGGGGESGAAEQSMEQPLRDVTEFKTMFVSSKKARFFRVVIWLASCVQWSFAISITALLYTDEVYTQRERASVRARVWRSYLPDKYANHVKWFSTICSNSVKFETWQERSCKHRKTNSIDPQLRLLIVCVLACVCVCVCLNYVNRGR